MISDDTMGRQLVMLFVLAIPIASIAWTVTHEDLYVTAFFLFITRDNAAVR